MSSESSLRALPDRPEEPATPIQDTFKYFPLLPPEIRHQIWAEHFKIKPRLLTLHNRTRASNVDTTVYNEISPVYVTAIDPETNGRWKPPSAAVREAHMVGTKVTAVAVNESIASDMVWSPWGYGIWYLPRYHPIPTCDAFKRKIEPCGSPLPVVWAADILYITDMCRNRVMGCLRDVEWADKIQRLAVRNPCMNQHDLRMTMRKLKSLKLLVIVAAIPYNFIKSLSQKPFTWELSRDEFGFIPAHDVINGLDSQRTGQEDLVRSIINRCTRPMTLELAVKDILEEDPDRDGIRIRVVVDIDGRVEELSGGGYWRE